MLLALPPAAQAHGGAVATGTVTGSVTVIGGNDDTAVYVYVLDDSDPAGTVYPDEEIGQRSQKFEKDLLVIPKGTRVYFPNNDTEQHNVFSPDPWMDIDAYGPTPKSTSKGKSNRKGKGKGKERKDPSHLYDQAGEIDLYCDIHKDMKAKVMVMPSSRFVKVKPDGSFSLEVPAGKHQTIVVWTPNAYDVDDVRPAVDVVANTINKIDAPIKIKAIADKESHLKKDGTPYKDDYGDR